jgi:hypothetical protein
MPWCPQYVEKVAEAAPEAESDSSGDCEAVAGQCHEHIDHSNEQEMEQLIARIHAAMAEDCDCPRHGNGDAEIGPAVLKRISAAITRDETFASLTTVRAAIADVLDAGCSCTNEKHPWELDDTTAEELDVTNGQRVRFIDDVCRRILELQREPHGMDAGLRVVATALRQRESEVRAEAWQPIETAPINERILVIYPTGEGGEIHIATLADYQISGSTQNWLSSSWAIHGIGTHVIPISWQPLPAIRRDSEAQEGE